MKKPFLWLVLSFTIFAAVKAQAPASFNYQAVARYADGIPVQSHPVGLRISIVDGSANGSVIYTEEHEVITSESGLFILEIGKGTSSQSFSDINWNSGQTKWLRVEMDISNTANYTLMGATQLLSVPYALFAQESGRAAQSDMILATHTDESRAEISTPAEGMMIFNESTHSLNVFKNGDWYEVALNKILLSWKCGDPLTDERDGQSYSTVQIGSQCWMAENLNVGQFVALLTGQTDNGLIERYCYDNNESYGSLYGGLYTWNEMMGYTKTPGAQGICPDGWHIPTDAEWQGMELALGMSANEAARPNIWRGTNQGTQLKPGGGSGYDVAYSGRSVPGFGFTALGSFEYVWTSTESSGNAWRRCMDTDSPQIGRYDTFPKTYGMSVRCVKN